MDGWNVAYPRFHALSLEQVLKALRLGGSHDRAQALITLTQRANGDDAVLQHVVAAIDDPRNHRDRIFAYSIAHFGVAGLIMAGSEKALSAAQTILAAWPEIDREIVAELVEQETRVSIEGKTGGGGA
ncbi:MAG TPA: hypothetical protein VNT75_24295 [Symbiobacteriaceae bacterium]|nr:hypothetical protein [Symbiobacteriaceae bacterium]